MEIMPGIYCVANVTGANSYLAVSNVCGLLLSIVLMAIICATFIGSGLISATKSGDTEDFIATVNLILFPFL